MTDRMQRILLISFAFVILVVNVAYSLWFHVQYPMPVPEEVIYTLPTVEYLINERAPLQYIYNNAYMAPLTETCAAPVCAVFGVNVLTTRLIATLFFSLSALVLFVVARSWYGTWAAWAFAVGYAAVPMSTVMYRIVQPGYGVGFVCVLLLLLACNKPGPKAYRYLLAGLASGLAYYLFPVCIGYILALLGVLWLADKEMINQAVNFAAWRRPINLALTAIAICSIGALGYRHLTHGGISYLVWAGFGVGVVSLAAAVVRVRGTGEAMTQLALRTSLFAIPFLAIHGVERWVYWTFTRPHFDELGVHVVQGAGSVTSYSWKTWPSWPSQVVHFVETTVPSLFNGIPQPGHFYHEGPEPTLGFRGITILGLLVLVITIAWWRREQIAAYASAQPAAVMPVLALSIMVVMLVPSWRLCGDWSVRYLVPYMPGILTLPFVLFPHSARVQWCSVVCYSLIAAFVMSDYFTTTLTSFSN